MTSISSMCLGILGQIENLLVEITPRDFVRSSVNLSGSSIGQHIRHTLEFLTCLEAGFGVGIINYDKRAHDRSVETDKTKALIVIDRIRKFIVSNQHNRSLVLQGIYDADSMEVYSIDTNFYRELAYNVEHAVHHMAMIKIGVNEVAPYLRLPEGFGVAASTIRYAASRVSF